MTVFATLAPSFDQLCTAVPATIGLAIAAPGRPEVYALGRWSTGVAWSTIKVPLAIAALRSDRPATNGLVAKTITESDNPAAESLWSQLGDPADAARQVQAVIRETGDNCTLVESRRLRPGFTAFGQTRWSLSRQALFAAHLPGLREAATVVNLMRHLSDGQRWGLAAKGIAAKGGWGPGTSGGYLVRQFGMLPTNTGHMGVALAAEATGFETGVDALNQITDWLASQLPRLSRD